MEIQINEIFKKNLLIMITAVKKVYADNRALVFSGSSALARCVNRTKYKIHSLFEFQQSALHIRKNLGPSLEGLVKVNDLLPPFPFFFVRLGGRATHINVNIGLVFFFCLFKNHKSVCVTCAMRG